MAATPPGSAPKLLIVEDEELARLSYAAVLRRAGYEVVEAVDGRAALEMVGREKPALILLDIDMPGLSGWATLDRLQQAGAPPPVIVLTGHTDIEDRVKGLGAGADDYLCKPCDHRELLARVHAVLRRAQPAARGITTLHFGGIQVDLANRTAFRAGEVISLTRTEYALLEFFAAHHGQRLTREQILEAVWGYPAHTNTRTVETHVWRLRQKLGDQAGEPRWLQTVAAGGGYRLVSDGLKD